MTAINFSALQLLPNDLIRVYSKRELEPIQGTLILKSDLTLFCRTTIGLMEIPVKEVERIVILSPAKA
jgi:hypothetical protein